MSSLMNTDSELDEEIKELLQNYKYKKSTTYEPCTRNNVKECLIGLSEEFNLLNINFIFNPYIDIESDVLKLERLVELINSVWILLHNHKNTCDKVEKLTEQNHILEHNNKHMNTVIDNLKKKLNIEVNESKACVASAQKAADRSDEILQSLQDARAKLTLVSKQKCSTEKCLRHEIIRLKKDNEKLLDKMRRNSGGCKSSEPFSSTFQLEERIRHQNAVIAKLQGNNQELIREVLDLKEELILSGIKEMPIN